MFDFLEVIGEENRKQNEFVTSYILEHFGERPADIVQAQSDALDAYWKSQGLVFGTDEETFIIPGEIYTEIERNSDSETFLIDDKEASTPFLNIDPPSSYKVSSEKKEDD